MFFCSPWKCPSWGGAGADREPAVSPEHFVVARESGGSLAWPANQGPGWSWGREVLVAFCAAAHAQRGPTNHSYDPAQPMHVWLARSLDGGETWRLEKPDALQHHKNAGIRLPREPDGGIRSNDPDCIVLCDYEDEDRGRTWFQISQDRGRTWGARQWLPTFGLGGCLWTDRLPQERCG